MRRQVIVYFAGKDSETSTYELPPWKYETDHGFMKLTHMKNDKVDHIVIHPWCMIEYVVVKHLDDDPPIKE